MRQAVVAASLCEARLSIFNSRAVRLRHLPSPSSGVAGRATVTESTTEFNRLSLRAMTLQEHVDSDLKEAMRAKDATKLGVLRMLKSALKYAAIAKSGAEAELNDAEAAQVIRKQARQRQDSIESFEKAGRTELAEKEKEELAILNAYLPQAMSADELATVVRETIAEAGAASRAQMGAVMKALQAKVGGRVDGKTLSAEVQKQLSG
jgi:uncharacterized protein